MVAESGTLEKPAVVKAKPKGRGKAEKYRLASDVRVLPETELPEDARESLGIQSGRYAVFRPGARTGPLLVDGEIAALLQEFEEPSCIAESLVRLGERQQRDPQEVLREIFPTLRLLVERRYLVDADSPESRGSETSVLDSGARVGGLVIVRPVQRMEDTEVFQVRLAGRRFGALKIANRRPSQANGGLAHEAEVLRLLGGDPSPELLATGEYEDRHYLVLEWRTGSNALVAAAGRRLRDGVGDRERLRDICCRILEAYGLLHRRGVVHGDVNARNVLVDRRDLVTLLDFQTAAPVDSSCGRDPPWSRAGVPIYHEPELAQAELDGEPLPGATPLGEQYSLAALVYQIITGETYVDFDLRRDRLLEQIVEQLPASFTSRGTPSWPAVEGVLARALSKEPDRRFPSVDDMAAALAAAEPPDPMPRSRASSKASHLDEVISLIIEKTARDGEWTTKVATSGIDSSVYRGAAGVAIALARISQVTGQPAPLETADWWIRQAIERLNRKEVNEDESGASFLVGSAGAHFVDATIAEAVDQPDREEHALRRLQESVAADPLGLDLYDGRSGRMLTLSSIMDSFGTNSLIDRPELRALGQESVSRLWSDLDRLPPVAGTIGDLGMAHGWAGHLFSTLRWCRLVGAPLPAGLERRLRELSEESVPVGRGLMWPWRLPLGGSRSPQFTAGWCNGSAGFVFLWTAASRTFGDEPWLELARGAAWNAWESAQRDGSLCCGLVGRAFALLHLSRETGDKIWIDRARDLAGIAVRAGVFNQDCPWGLFQGRLGLGLLAVDLLNPNKVRLPFIA